MSDTPETDEAVKASNGQWSFVLKETCQRLERERDDLRKQLNAATSALRQIHLEVGDWIRFTVIGDEK